MTDVCYHDFPPPRTRQERRCRKCGLLAATFARATMAGIPIVHRRLGAHGAVPLEKVEQAQILELLKAIGASWYEIGRPRARLCWYCKKPSKDLGMRQTPGIPDLWVFLPAKKNSGPFVTPTFLWIEAKRAKDGRLSDEQRDFRDECRRRGIPHVDGSYDRVVDWLQSHRFLEAA